MTRAGADHFRFRVASGPPIRGESGPPWPSFTTPRLILEALVHSGLARMLAWAVSDRGTLGGLTQFATQFGFAGSATSL